MPAALEGNSGGCQVSALNFTRLHSGGLQNVYMSLCPHGDGNYQITGQAGAGYNVTHHRRDGSAVRVGHARLMREARHLAQRHCDDKAGQRR